MSIIIESGISVEQGIKVGNYPAVPSLILNLDAATYGGAGDWIDTVGSKIFTLYNSPTYSAVTGGGSFCLFHQAINMQNQAVG